MRSPNQSRPARRSRFVASAAAALSLLCAASRAPASTLLFADDFESYAASSNLIGQGGWAGETNQGSPSELPVTEGSGVLDGLVLDTRAIVQADRIHQGGHVLPSLNPGEVTTLSVAAYASADSINTGVGLGENAQPGSEIGSEEGYFSDYRAVWAFAAPGWFFDVRGIAGNDFANLFTFDVGAGQAVTLRIVIDGPAGLVYGQMVTEDATLTTPSRPITAEQIAALDAVALYTDRSLPNRAGLELDDFELTAGPSGRLPTCGDVNDSGSLSASDALAVLKAAVGLGVELHCDAPGRPLSTGQRTCHEQDGSEISCLGTRQDGELQLGVPRAFVDNGDGTIGDAATGLTWEKLSDDDSIHDAANTYTWAAAFEKVAALNEAGFAGHSDWRLPNVRELETLEDFDVGGPPLPEIFRQPCPPGATVLSGSCAPVSYHWSSSTWRGNLAAAWVVEFEGGLPSASLKATSRSVRAVRGGH